jgi:hypothetical protein
VGVGQEVYTLPVLIPESLRDYTLSKDNNPQTKGHCLGS